MKVLFNEDKLLRENIENYSTYKKLKAIKSDKVKVLKFSSYFINYLSLKSCFNKVSVELIRICHFFNGNVCTMWLCCSF